MADVNTPQQAADRFVWADDDFTIEPAPETAAFTGWDAASPHLFTCREGDPKTGKVLHKGPCAGKKKGPAKKAAAIVKAVSPPAAAKKADAPATERRRKAVPRGRGSDPLAQRRAKLEEGIASGIAQSVPLGGGGMGNVDRVTFNNGTVAIRKFAPDDNMYNISAKQQQDAEEIASKVAAAIGIPAPAVSRVDEDEIYMEFMPDKPGMGRVPGAWWAATGRQGAPGKRIGLLDILIDNSDRNPGNYLLPDVTIRDPSAGDITAIDHGLAFAGSPSRPGLPWGSDFSRDFIRGQNPLTARDVAVLGPRLEALRGDFNKVKRPRWFKDMMMRWEILARNAGGTEDVLNHEPTTAAFGCTCTDLYLVPKVQPGPCPKHPKPGAKVRPPHLSEPGRNVVLKAKDAPINTPPAKTKKVPVKRGAAKPGKPPTPNALDERRRKLAAGVASGIKTETQISMGQIAQVHKIEFNDGTFAIRKKAKAESPGITAEQQQDAEEVASLVAHALDATAPAVLRTAPDEVFMEFMPDPPGMGRVKYEWARNSRDAPAGRRLGILDLLISNHDRHAGNYLLSNQSVKDLSKGDITAIDHGFAFALDPSPVFPLGGGSVFSVPFERAQNPLSKADAAKIGPRLAALAPEFERRGRREWFDAMMNRWQLVAKNASGRGTILK